VVYYHSSLEAVQRLWLLYAPYSLVETLSAGLACRQCRGQTDLCSPHACSCIWLPAGNGINQFRVCV